MLINVYDVVLYNIIVGIDREVIYQPVIVIK